jgi:adenylosuccinate synthase
VRLGDMYRGGFRDQIEQIVAAKNRSLAVLFPPNEFKPLEAGAIFREYSNYAERLRPYVCDTTEMLLAATESGKRLLFEGAQGALLDVDHGTYPYVTSSNSSGVGISGGSGVPMKYVDRVIGVVKAYSTRVGGGPFPTELDNELGQYLRDRGNEYGTVTRRPRRCGWLDAVALRYTTRLSGVDTIAVMLLDVLSGMKEINVCTAYELDGKQISRFPSHVDDVRRVKPVYETLPGWADEVTACRKFEQLPANARAYLGRVSELIGRPIEMVSVGPERDATIVLGKS